MQKNSALLLAITLLTNLFIQSTSTTWPLQGKSFFLPRSQGVNAARDIVGWHHFINHTDTSGFYGAFAITPEYNRAYKTRTIAEYFFGTDVLCISGSTVSNRGYNDILADYFGLPTDYQSQVTVLPKIQNALVDFACYFGWGPFYVQIHSPYVWNQTQIELKEDISLIGSDIFYPTFYMAQAPIIPPAENFKQAMAGGFTWGDVSTGLEFGKIACNSLSEKMFADVDIAIGWNFLRRERGLIGSSLRMTIPTGTKPSSRYLLEPLIGNGHHWQVGVGVNAQGLLWEKDAEQSVNLFFDINIMHLFKAKQIRSFDLKDNGFGSRYILVKEFDSNGVYTGKTEPLINITSLMCNTDAAIQIDFVIMFAYQNKNYNFDIGYNGWIRSAEGIELIDCFDNKKWGLKGIANVANFSGPINDTQSSATLHGNNLSNQAIVIDSNPPVLLNTCDLDLRSGAASRQFTHKIFVHGGYTWEQYHKIKPYAGLGFSVEFEGARPKDLQPNKNAMSLWALWFKTGIGF